MYALQAVVDISCLILQNFSPPYFKNYNLGGLTILLVCKLSDPLNPE